MFGCSDDNSSDSGNGNGDTDNFADTDIDTDSDSDSDSDGDFCKSATVGTSVDPVYLVFAFDVSGSMGKMDYPWHDPELKWNPIVAAAKSFLEDPQSAGFFASMTFFPSHDGDKCEAATYETPDVPFTLLPSNIFGNALDVIGAEDWEGGTPTTQVMDGLMKFIKTSKKENPGKYAIVLVTDGYPQGCDNNDIDAVVDIAQQGVENGILTYVIGVNNPPVSDAPDTTSNLGEIAVAGGTSKAFMIDTGDPEKTTSKFAEVIQEIQTSSFSCSITIPEPPSGREFDKEKIIVTASNNGIPVKLTYDPDCTTQNSWHYDNKTDPAKIMMCEETCNKVQTGDDPAFNVEFTCVKVIEIGIV